MPFILWSLYILPLHSLPCLTDPYLHTYTYIIYIIII